MKNRFLIPILMTSICFTSITKAQWIQTNGPEGGQINCFAAIDDNLFAGTRGGLFRSTDEGDNWTPINNGLWNPGIQSLSVHGDYLFAATDGAGIFRSSDRGDTWTNVVNGLTNYSVGALVSKGTYIFAGTAGDGVFRSSTDGTYWTKVNNGLSSYYITTLSVLDTDLFAGTWGGGVFRIFMLEHGGKVSFVLRTWGIPGLILVTI